ncbi:hypothetical protein C8Q76DRAFT_753850 [Earliella scabrosa]|nr:hypothetical protein C8Q76DRAFT_753850 [Earliella scabrosa]
MMTHRATNRTSTKHSAPLAMLRAQGYSQGWCRVRHPLRNIGAVILRSCAAQ